MPLQRLTDCKFRISTLLWMVLAGAMPGGETLAQVARVEVFPIVTATLTTTEFLTGKVDGKRDTIAGELRIPLPGSNRLPAVILMHGGGGVSANDDDWAQHFNAMGIATLVLDSFTGRGGSRSSIAALARIVDAYRALELLARHPRIDPDRIALMGFSHGSQAALYSSMKRFANRYGPADGRKFAAHIAFYPGCHVEYLEGRDLTNRPIRIFHGEADDVLSIASCREYVARLREAGNDVALSGYPGAHHSFDNRLRKEPERDQGDSFIRCRVEESPRGQLLNSDTQQPFNTQDPCVDRGRTLG
jgi:dienelactone hydrolase